MVREGYNIKRNLPLINKYQVRNFSCVGHVYLYSCTPFDHAV